MLAFGRTLIYVVEIEIEIEISKCNGFSAFIPALCTARQAPRRIVLSGVLAVFLFSKSRF